MCYFSLSLWSQAVVLNSFVISYFSVLLYPFGSIVLSCLVIAWFLVKLRFGCLPNSLKWNRLLVLFGVVLYFWYLVVSFVFCSYSWVTNFGSQVNFCKWMSLVQGSRFYRNTAPSWHCIWGHGSTAVPHPFPVVEGWNLWNAQPCTFYFVSTYCLNHVITHLNNCTFSLLIRVTVQWYCIWSQLVLVVSNFVKDYYI